MNDLQASDFDEFFESLTGRSPYPWQRRLADMATQGRWPDVIDIPTGCGKTACIDIAAFALACQAATRACERSAPRRIFFCVNRRVIVDEAYARSVRLARRLYEAEVQGPPAGILFRVAQALRAVAGGTTAADGPPLDVLELRGGVYRDARWARSVTQPLVVCTTVDQLGSRMLFRGYGVSSLAAPIQAALVTWDSLILLDEAHISRPFLQTLEAIRLYNDPQKWAREGLALQPMRVVPMTATPVDVRGADLSTCGLTDEDRKAPSLRRRLAASKPARLVAVRKGRMEAEIVSAVLELVANRPLAVAVIVNRVERARAVFRALIENRTLRRRQPDAAVELVIGAMRPCDRDAQEQRLDTLVGPDRPEITERTCIVVATQCLEVGADYDFDALVTECASLDALRQRFGRLNRAGRPIEAQAVIVVDQSLVKPEQDLREDKPLDPIYGNALTRTWHWLCERAGGAEGRVDFGIDAMADAAGDSPVSRRLVAPSATLDAPTLLPAHLDALVQTSPKPVPDIDVSLFLHGPQRGAADVLVCWRADLDPEDPSHWVTTVGLLPPSAAECMAVGLHRLRRWLTGDLSRDATSDLLGEQEDEREPRTRPGTAERETPPVLLWRGKDEARVLSNPDDVRPGDTVVVPVRYGGWDELGHVALMDGEDPSLVDVAESAFRAARSRPVLRIHPALSAHWSDVPGWASVLDSFSSSAEEWGIEEWREALRELRSRLDDSDPRCRTVSDLLSLGFTVQAYPNGSGVVFAGRRRLPSVWFTPALDEGDDSLSRIDDRQPVPLDDHIEHVHDVLEEFLARLPLERWRSALEAAVLLHDIGKADERFQALLLGQDRTTAWLHAGMSGRARPLAKSEGLPLSPGERALAGRRAGVPQGFRHEMLSLQLAECAEESPLPSDEWARDLALHLVSAHHGHARPFAPVALDRDPPRVEVEIRPAGRVIKAALEGRWRCTHPPHRPNSGIAERFWRLVRQHGWWGLAYLEAVVRLADQLASARESSGAYSRSAGAASSEGDGVQS